MQLLVSMIFYKQNLHNNDIWDVQFSLFEMYTGSDDQTVQILQFLDDQAVGSDVMIDEDYNTLR